MNNRIERKRLVAAALAVVLLGGCAATPTQESTGEYIDDTTLTSKVKTSLLQDPEVSGLAINVETFKGEVRSAGSPITKRNGNGLRLWLARYPEWWRSQTISV